MEERRYVKKFNHHGGALPLFSLSHLLTRCCGFDAGHDQGRMNQLAYSWLGFKFDRSRWYVSLIDLH